MKYLLDAPDEEMAEWHAAADKAGLTFAEWLRRTIRRGHSAQNVTVHVHTPPAVDPELIDKKFRAAQAKRARR